MKPLVIIHGWSDEDESFIPLAEELQQKTGRQVEQLWLGNYVSLDDDVRMSDLVRGLQRAWESRGLPEKPRAVDVIVHSTGGLIIRDWMDREYSAQDRKPPVNNLVMLAPANFGSPLAHKGRAFYGRVMKGFQSRKRFQTGTHILKALEMASPWSRELADRDRLGPNVFSASGVRATVIVGNTGYSGISSLANEDGSDGTVYVSTANLDCHHVRLEFPSGAKQPKVRTSRKSRGDTAFLVLDGHNHGSVALKDPEHSGNSVLLTNIVKALEICNAGQFRDWVKQCRDETSKVMDRHAGDKDTYKHAYQNTVIRVHDDQGFDVTDYVVEFYQDVEKGLWDRLAELFNRKAISTVHTYGDNPAFRSFMINCTELRRIVDEEGEALKISLSAMPDLDDGKTMVGYRSFQNEDIGCLVLGPKRIREFFVPNRTLFLDITLNREQKEELFALGRLDERSARD